MNRKVCQSFQKYIRTCTTAADTFAGTVKIKGRVHQTKYPPASYGGRYIVTMVPGEGLGPTMMNCVKEVFDAARVPIDFEIIEGEKDFEEQAILSIRRNGVGIIGNVPTLSDYASDVFLRARLDLYVYVAYCITYPGVKCKYPGLNIVVIRQNTEGEYAMLEHSSKPGIVESLKIITRQNTERLAKWAFEYCKKENRNKVTVVHKANIMKYTDGLFLKTVLEVAKDYPDIKVNDVIVDNCTMQLVSKPEQFDVILTSNLYGNIIVNIVCGLTGGPGLLSAQNFGNLYAVFECASRHHCFICDNPVALLVASVRMLDYMDLADYAELIYNGIYKTLVKDKIHTSDLGGNSGGQEMTEHIKRHIRDDFKNSKINAF